MIVYLPAEDIEQPTVLFVKIYSAKGNKGPYSIRVFNLGESAILPDDLPAYDYSGSATNDADSPYEEQEANLDIDPWNDTYASDEEGPAVIPFGSGTGDRFHRYLDTPDDIDWIRFTVP
jgi:hypothetical protein